jgi:hypothetical protein
MDHLGGVKFFGFTVGLWMLQALTLSNVASIATILAGLGTAAFHIYSLYRKVQDDHKRKQ